MSTRISFSRIETPKSLLQRLPRFKLDFRVNRTKIEVLYTPVTETIFRALKEKKGIVAIAKKQFAEFEQIAKKKTALKRSK